VHPWPAKSLIRTTWPIIPITRVLLQVRGGCRALGKQEAPIFGRVWPNTSPIGPPPRRPLFWPLCRSLTSVSRTTLFLLRGYVGAPGRILPFALLILAKTRELRTLKAIAQSPLSCRLLGRFGPYSSRGSLSRRHKHTQEQIPRRRCLTKHTMLSISTVHGPKYPGRVDLYLFAL
jgi:hypothetical protein